MNRRLLVVPAAIAALTAATLTGAPAASAATQDCPAGTLCLWEDHDFNTNGHGGQYYSVTNYVGHLGSKVYRGTGDIVGDTSSSGFNASASAHYRMYKNANCVGPYFDEGPRWGDSNFGNGSPTFSDGSAVSDQISSVVKLNDSAALTACRNA